MDHPSISLLTSLFNHLALPLQLPGKHESKIEEIELALTIRLLDATRYLRLLTGNDASEMLDYIRRSLETCKLVNANGRLNKSSLLNAFRGLERREVLILHVAQQNAGLLIRRHNAYVIPANSVCFNFSFLT